MTLLKEVHRVVARVKANVEDSRVGPVGTQLLPARVIVAVVHGPIRAQRTLARW